MEMNESLPVIVLGLLLLAFAACLYGVYRQFRAGETPQRRPRSRSSTVNRAPEPSKPEVEQPQTESATVDPEDATQEEDPAEWELPARQERTVDYPADYGAELSEGGSFFLLDAKQNVRIWAPGWLPQTHLVYRGESRGGLAHGRGEATIAVSRTDHSPYRRQGEFRDGLYLGDAPFSQPIIALPEHDFLIGLPSPRSDDAQFWAHGSFVGDAFLVQRCAGRSRDVVVVAPTETTAMDEDLLRELMCQGEATFREQCPTKYPVSLRVVPRVHQRVSATNETRFEPVLASATVLHVPDEGQEIRDYRNQQVAAENKRSQEEERQAARERGERNAPLRGRGADVRGVRLGMKIEDALAVLGDDVAEWDGPRESLEKDRPFRRPQIKITLNDGATFNAEFTSRTTGSELFVFVYEQQYRAGISPDDVIGKLEQKYGKPDRIDHRPTGTYWGSYDLVSSIHPPNKAFGSHGAFFKTHVRANSAGMAEMLRIVFNDATLSRHDEAAVYSARLKEEQQRYEDSKSDDIKF